MSLGKLQQLVQDQYDQRLAERDSWCDWLYEQHVPWVAERTRKLCGQYGGDAEIAVAAALVHDIADSVMSRFDEDHEQRSLEIGRELCEKAGFSSKQIAIIIDDICAKHSCRDGVVPESLEGKVMATADACFHFETDFFLYAFYRTEGDFDSFNARKQWMIKKLEKDFRSKIFFEEVREQVKPIYETLRSIVG